MTNEATAARSRHSAPAAREHDVVIAGGGPVGLMLACELRLHDVPVLVVERLTGPDDTIKAGMINGRSADAFVRRGLGDALDACVARIRAELGAALPGGPDRPMRQGHFAGIFKVGFLPDELPVALDVLRASPRGLGTAGPLGLRTMTPRPAFVPQVELERLLLARALELGAEIRHGHAVTDHRQDAGGVTVVVAGERGAEELRAGYLVGCDGGRSTVRKREGFAFPGTAPTITGHQAIVELADPEKLTRGWQRGEGGVAVYGPMPGRILTVEFDGPPADRDAPITLAELQTSLRRTSGTDVTIERVVSATRFTDNTRLAGTFRSGRVLLAGDAAHVHSPFGGQGLNLGLQDAVNLGWKLAGVLAGRAPDALLDTYDAERRPVAERVLANTRAQVALLRPDEQTSALHALFGELMDLEQVTWYLTELMSGAGIRYPAAPDAHPLVGRYHPDLALDGVGRVADLGHDGGGVLLDLADDPALRKVAAGWSDRVTVVTARSAEAGSAELTALLIRPDGYVAWLATAAGTAAADADPAGLAAALTAWFGAEG